MPKDYKKLSDDELTQECSELYAVIHTTECFGVSDLTRYELICRELERRGIIVTPSITFVHKEPEEEEEND